MKMFKHSSESAAESAVLKDGEMESEREIINELRKGRLVQSQTFLAKI